MENMPKSSAASFEAHEHGPERDVQPRTEASDTYFDHNDGDGMMLLSASDFRGVSDVDRANSRVGIMQARAALQVDRNSSGGDK